MKYFMAASVDAAESRFSATMAYRHRDSSSSPMYTVRKLLADISTIMPSSAKRSSVRNSPFINPRSSRYWREYTSAVETAM